MTHLVLLGDSIFDNASYVPDGISVISHLRQLLNAGDRASLLAVDGDCIPDVATQLQHLPDDATHLFISVGGNDALHYATRLQNTGLSFPAALQQIAAMKTDFLERYSKMLTVVSSVNKPITLCTIYDQCPIEALELRLLAYTVLSMFNDCITRQAIDQGLPLIDLRVICHEASDYAEVSPIEPSTTGGQKIAHCITTVVNQHDFSVPRSVCYV